MNQKVERAQVFHGRRDFDHFLEGPDERLTRSDWPGLNDGMVFGMHLTALIPFLSFSVSCNILDD
jgi:hypothetical protein